MKRPFRYNLYGIALVFSGAMLFFSCADNYERVGEEALPLVFPQGIAENFSFRYSEAKEDMGNGDVDTTKVISVLSGPITENYENLEFPYRTFPKGISVDIFDEDNNRNKITADYCIRYSSTGLIDLRGNVVLETHDGKKLETPRLYYDQSNNWAFTEEEFKYTNPEEGTVMDGEGMDFNRDFTFLNAHKTYGLMTIKEELND
ncbi:LPS export ABC transporter periplasmic protein LptC [Maribacter polysaccharolyticus]|uniref:LPS export ABC transporter periplasmic protein LptC n=1 Tax=Maribacter polysaccharolyticus TaxID=3020831 RepID=UPI00237F43BC|nr:LPS export ABC transporter periplasmic protein LptC [Maribacter polysaccharolyticus]MDE3742891.1 LPS export ABC transporter periplasmic protein LptC [Maribacter polysaccharolyticus]